MNKMRKEFKSKLIGKKVYIKENIDSIWAGETGTIKYFDGDYYHIHVIDTQPIFKRNEFIVPKDQRKIPSNQKELEEYLRRNDEKRRS